MKDTINLEYDCGLYARWNREISDCIVCSVHVAVWRNKRFRRTVKTKEEIMDMLKKKSASTVGALRIHCELQWVLRLQHIIAFISKLKIDKSNINRAETVAKKSCRPIIYASFPEKRNQRRNKSESWTAVDLFSIAMENSRISVWLYLGTSQSSLTWGKKSRKIMSERRNS